jgi:trigger factor
MKIDLSDISPVKKALAVEVDSEEVSKETAAVLRRYSSQVRLPGFRQGKAPAEMVRKRFAKEIEADVRERLISRLWREAAQEKGLMPLGDPILDELEHEEGRPFRFKTTFEVLPQFTVKDWKGVEARRPKAEVVDREVADTLESIRQSHAKFAPDPARLAEPGDVLVADVTERSEGEEPHTRERMVIEVGAAGNPDAFNAKIAGAVTGASLEFPVDYPADHPNPALAGKRVEYTVRVHEVRRKEVPPLDDELAKDMGDFADLAALTARVRDDLGARKEAAAAASARQSVLDKILLANPVPLPDILVEEEIRHRLEDMVREMMFHGMDPRSMELDWKQLRDRQEEPARKTVHARLVLDSIAAAEQIHVERNEVRERIQKEAARIGEDYDALHARLTKGGGLQALETQLVREKTLDLVTSLANIQIAE